MFEGVGTELLKKYGLWAVVGLLVVVIASVIYTHEMAAPGTTVKLLFGLHEYVKTSDKDSIVKYRHDTIAVYTPTGKIEQRKSKPASEISTEKNKMYSETLWLRTDSRKLIYNGLLVLSLTIDTSRGRSTILVTDDKGNQKELHFYHWNLGRHKYPYGRDTLLFDLLRDGIDSIQISVQRFEFPKVNRRM